MDSNPVIYEQGQNKMGSYLDGNTQGRYVCAPCSQYHFDEVLP